MSTGTSRESHKGKDRGKTPLRSKALNSGKAAAANATGHSLNDNYVPVSDSGARKGPHDVSGPSASTDNSVSQNIMELLTGAIINMTTALQQILKSKTRASSYPHTPN